MPTTTERKNDVIQIRTTREAKALFQRAADMRQQKLSEFMLESAQLAAQDAILNHCLFVLDEARHAQLASLLDNPAMPDPEAVRRFQRSAPWGR